MNEIDQFTKLVDLSNKMTMIDQLTKEVLQSVDLSERDQRELTGIFTRMSKSIQKQKIELVSK
jgi:hypothetical protein